MLFLPSLLLGLVQGLAEFLPISSSAHLILVRWMCGWTDPVLNSLSFDVALHLGTLTAILVVFASDWRRILAAGWASVRHRSLGTDPDRRLAWLLVAATVPGALAGYFLEGQVQTAFHDLPIAPGALLAMAAAIAGCGALLWWADARGQHQRTVRDLTWKDALIVGLAQALAIFPGVSRSGATITAGLALGFDRTSAAKFSFLLSAPIIAGAGAKGMAEIAKGALSGALPAGELALFPVGFLAAAVAGFLCIRFLMGYLSRHSTRIFTWYRFALAGVLAAVVLSGGLR